AARRSAARRCGALLRCVRRLLRQRRPAPHAPITRDRKRQLVTPAEEYRHRLAGREAAAAQHEKRHNRIGLLRLAAFAAAVAAAWFSLRADAISPWWLLAPSALFLGLLVCHARVRRRRSRAERAAVFYRGGLARMEDRWSGQGVFGERFEDPHHVYSADLDLFGKGSLFELLCTARTRMGEQALARWLLAPAHASEIR